MKQLIVLAMLASLIGACDFVPQLAQPTAAQPAPTVAAESKPAPPQDKQGTLPALPPQGKSTLPAPAQGKQGTLPASVGTPQPPLPKETLGEQAQPTLIASVTNPTSGAKLYVATFLPQDSAGRKSPAVILIPGGNGDSSSFTRKSPRGDSEVGQFTKAGFAAVVFDPDGRGKSEGKEDYAGYAHQDGLRAVIQYTASLASVDAKQIGIVTYSYGITMGSGVLARYSDLPVKYLMDWEGPADRNDTGGCDGQGKGHLQQVASCSDEAFWRQREASTFIAQVRVPYQRVQSDKDHVQPDNSHAVNMVNAAVKGGVPWVRLNDYAANQTYDPKNPPKMFPETMDAQSDVVIIRYAQELGKK
jgi:pimeloyl-ACP methyl ester carboxylesterase